MEIFENFRFIKFCEIWKEKLEYDLKDSVKKFELLTHLSSHNLCRTVTKIVVIYIWEG